jgi:hypothetical protein
VRTGRPDISHYQTLSVMTMVGREQKLQISCQKLVVRPLIAPSRQLLGSGFSPVTTAQ